MPVIHGWPSAVHPVALATRGRLLTPRRTSRWAASICTRPSLMDRSANWQTRMDHLRTRPKPVSPLWAARPIRLVSLLVGRKA
jgi:hypothetical protein